MYRSRLWGALSAGMLLFFSTLTQAALVDRLETLPGSGVYQAYYDTVLDITWLANANLAVTNTFGVAGISADGTMNWNTANSWIAAMNTDGGTGYLGYNDWRLPKVSPIDGLAFDYNFLYDGTADRGYNISAPGTTYAGATGSEMAYMYYNNLSLAGYFNTSGVETGCSGSPPYCLTNTGPFSNLQNNVYLYSTEYAPITNFVWFFLFSDGSQSGYNKSTSFSVWAVRPGDTVPLPAAALLFGSGLLGLIGIARRRKSS